MLLTHWQLEEEVNFWEEELLVHWPHSVRSISEQELVKVSEVCLELVGDVDEERVAVGRNCGS